MLNIKKAILATLALAVLVGCGAQEGAVSGPPEGDSAKATPPEPMLISPPEADAPEPTKVTGEEKKAVPAPKQAAKPAQLPKTTKKPAKPKEIKNLIDNGVFGRWPSRQRVPTGWTHAIKYPSEDKMPSVIERLEDKRFVGGLATKQTWKRSDGADSVFKQFGVTVTGLKPNTKYGIRVTAHNQSKTPVIVAPYAVIKEGEQVERLTQGGVLVKPDPDFGEYATGFVTKEQTTVRLTAASTATEEEAYPLTVVWDEWVLFEVGPDTSDAQ